MPPQDNTIAGHSLMGVLGQGSCGEVHLARSPSGQLRAVKFFKAMAINRRLLQGAYARLAESEGHPGVVRVHRMDFDARPAWVVMDYHGNFGDEGAEPWSLDDWLGQNLERETAWHIVRQMAEALAFLHRIGVAHANLQPRNVLVAEPEQGNIVLSDFCQGWLDGVYHMEGGEALLYASPEQLREPEGIEQGVWGGWDVHSFGFLAFRLLTGKFPRDDAARRRLERRRLEEGVAISPSAVLPLFPPVGRFEWGEALVDWEESARRRIIEGCLDIDPATRFKDMREVLGSFEKLDEEIKLREERERIRSLRLKEVKALRVTRLVAVALGVACVTSTLAALVYANRYRVTAGQLDDLKARQERMLGEKEAEVQARESEARRREELAKAQAVGAARETSVIKETLIRSREQADALFAVVRDRKPATHPGFKDLSQIATELSEFYEDFLASVGEDAAMAEERARALDNLSELAQARDDQAAAGKWLLQAVAVWEKLAHREPRETEYRARLANDALKLSQIHFQNGEIAESVKSAGVARRLLETLAKEKPGDDDIARQLAACYLQQGRIDRQQGNAGPAMEKYREASDRLHTLAAKTGRFDYRSELAHSYVELGELARGIEDLEMAANVQRAALGQLVAMVEEKPEMVLPKLDLARVYGELGEIECEAGNPDKGAELLEKSSAILNELAAASPAAEEILYQKARRIASLGRAYRDQGKRVESEKMIDEANAILARLEADHPDNAYYGYQLALAKWQKAELYSDLSQLKEAVDTMHAAMTILDALAARSDIDGTQRKQVQVSMAYLTGDLGHRLEESNRREDALAAFQHAAKRWEEIAATYGEDSVTTDALTWCRRRLEELRAP